MITLNEAIVIQPAIVEKTALVLKIRSVYLTRVGDDWEMVITVATTNGEEISKSLTEFTATECQTILMATEDLLSKKLSGVASKDTVKEKI